MKNWIVAQDNDENKGIGLKFGISPIFEKILLNRNIKTEYEMAVYLNPNINYLRDTMLFKDIKIAFELLSIAIYNSRKIIIYGDYDVDGVSSTVILYKGLLGLGANVSYYIPDREKEGYGLNAKAVKKLKEMGGELIFTCDNGIAAFDEVMLLKNYGMNIIVLDHHEPQFVQDNETNKKKDVIPRADAVIDAKQEDCPYPFKALCAGGMSYKFIKAYYKFLKIELKNEAELFAFASIATVCDIVDLNDENRILVRNGLKLINNRKNLNVGLSELIKLRQLDDKRITETSIGFVIGPCINACGRLETALKAVELFITEDRQKAKELANEISQLNDKRKAMTQNAVDKIINEIQEGKIKIDKVIVAYDEDIHESIAGIVAGRIKDEYYRPTIVLTKSSEKGIAKGSARSIDKYNIFENLHKQRILLSRYGGHSMAAGLSLKVENIDELRDKLNEECMLSEEDMIPCLKIDMKLDFKDISLKLADELDLMRPMGKENDPPLFLCENARIKRVNFVGANKNIMQLNLEDSFGYKLNAIDFNNYNYFTEEVKNVLDSTEYETLISGAKKETDLNVDLVYEIGVNEFNGARNIQLKIVDYKFNK